MSDVTHTPTPWKVGQVGWDFLNGIVYGHAEFGDIEIGHTSARDCGSMDCEYSPLKTQAEANTAFIVRACNAHHDLVASVRELRDDMAELTAETLRSVCSCSDGAPDRSTAEPDDLVIVEMMEGMIRRADAAIAKAEPSP